jgi:hypothetical protein
MLDMNKTQAKMSSAYRFIIERKAICSKFSMILYAADGFFMQTLTGETYGKRT